MGIVQGGKRQERNCLVWNKDKKGVVEGRIKMEGELSGVE